MKRNILLLTASIIITMVFSGCRFWHSVQDNSYFESGEQFEDILSAIKDRDSDALIAMFSKAVRDEVGDDELEEGCEYIYGFFQGEVQSWRYTGGATSESYTNGKKSVDFGPSYEVVTDSETYDVSYKYIFDEINDDQVGLKWLMFLYKKDIGSLGENMAWDWGPGIFQPDKAKIVELEVYSSEATAAALEEAINAIDGEIDHESLSKAMYGVAPLTPSGEIFIYIVAEKRVEEYIRSTDGSGYKGRYSYYDWALFRFSGWVPHLAGTSLTGSGK